MIPHPLPPRLPPLRPRQCLRARTTGAALTHHIRCWHRTTPCRLTMMRRSAQVSRHCCPVRPPHVACPNENRLLRVQLRQRSGLHHRATALNRAHCVWFRRPCWIRPPMRDSRHHHYLDAPIRPREGVRYQVRFTPAKRPSAEQNRPSTKNQRRSAMSLPMSLPSAQR